MPSLGGVAVSLPIHAATLGLANGNRRNDDHPTAWAKSDPIDERQSTFRVKLDPGPVQGRPALGGNTGIESIPGDWQAQIGGPGRDRLVACLTLHPHGSSHERLYRVCKVRKRRWDGSREGSRGRSRGARRKCCAATRLSTVSDRVLTHLFRDGNTEK
jgi:hypothetical protein